MLTGITVVDFSRHLPGPICTMRLADLGAEVIEILPYPLDHALLSHSATGFAREPGAFTLRSHRNHKSVSLNLRTAEGKALAFALARQADVVVESYRPGVLRHLGLDYDSVWAAHPAVIYCSVTNYGQSGELSQSSGHDLNIQAVSGFLSAVRDDEGRPVVTDIPLADYAVGVYASEQICAALVHRARTGRGAYLDIASADLLTTWTGLHALLSKQSGVDQRTGAWSKDYVAYRVYETADGQFVAIAAREEKFWRNFCRAVGRADWESLHTATINQHHDLYEELCSLFLSRTQAEWGEFGMEVDCCLTAVEEQENWAENGYAQSREIAYSLPYLDRKTEPHTTRDHSWYIDHTHELLKKKCKMTAGDIRRLEGQGVIPVKSIERS